MVFGTFTAQAGGLTVGTGFTPGPILRHPVGMANGTRVLEYSRELH